LSIYHKKLYIKDTKGIVKSVPIYTTTEECNNFCIKVKDGNNNVYIPYSNDLQTSFRAFIKKNGHSFAFGTKMEKLECRMEILYPNAYRKMTSIDNIKDSLQTRINTNISLRCMFLDCKSLTSVPLFNTQHVTDMSNMFWNCLLLTNIPLFNIQNVIDISYMFYDCNSLTSIPTFNIRNVKRITNMLYNTKVTEVTFKNKPQDLQITSKILCNNPNQIKKINFI